MFSGNCINPINVREALISMTKEADLPDDTRKQYLEFLQDTLHKEYLDLLRKEITRAFVYSYQEQRSHCSRITSTMPRPTLIRPGARPQYQRRVAAG